MPADKATKQSPAAASGSLFPIDTEWARPLIEGPIKFYTEQLNFAARCLRSQADYLQGLADCKDVGEVFVQQTKLLQGASQEFTNEGARAWKVIQDASWFLRP